MTYQENLQRQIAQLISDARAQGHEMEQIVPKEVQIHFRATNELKEAQELIEQLEAREKDLQATNAALQTSLKASEEILAAKINDIENCEVDLNQARHQINYYQELSQDSRRRAERYQSSLALATKNQVTASELSAKNDQLLAKNEHLQRELMNQESTIRQLQDENQRAAEIFASLRAEDVKAMAAIEARLAELESHASVVETESEAFSEVFSNLVEKLECENTTAASLLNDKGVLLRKMELLYNVVASEISPLNRFFGRAFQMLQIYQNLFQKLSDPCVSGVGSLPQDLDALMEGAGQDIHAYHEMHEIFSYDGGMAEEHIRDELKSMSQSADAMLGSLRFIKRDVEGFLTRLHKEPGTWLAMKARFGGNIISKRALKG
ncbi:hypothetical protein ACJQWK_06865 [Exserohilum turcicum]